MKKLFLTPILLSATILSYGQTINFGLKAGINYSIFHYNGAYAPATPHYLTGFNAGAVIDIGLPGFLIQPGLLYSAKGEKYTQVVIAADPADNTSYIASNRLNYLELPVNVLYVIKNINFVKVRIGGGPYLGYPISGAVSGSGETNPYTPDKTPDYGLNALLEFDFKNGIMVNAGYQYGLGKANGYTFQNRVISVDVGYMFK